MAIAPVPSITFETVRAVSLGDAVREGQILEAKVTAMLTETVARLTIDGRPLDVATPKPLPVGAMMTLKAEREGGQLRLITQGPIRAGPNGAPLAGAGVSAGLSDTLMDPLKAVLAKVQALAIEAALNPRKGVEVAQQPPSAAAAFAALAEQAASSRRPAEQPGGQRAPATPAPAPTQGTTDEPATPGRPAMPPPASQPPAQMPLPLAESEAQEPASGPPSSAGQTPSAATPEATASPRATGQTPPQQPLPAPVLAQRAPEPAPNAQPAGQTLQPQQPTASPSAPQATQTLPAAGLQTLALEAALNQRAGAEAEPVQAPAAKVADPALGSLQALLAEGAGGEDLATEDAGATLRPASEIRPHAAATASPTPADTDLPDPAALATKIAAAAHDAAPETRHTAPPPDLPQIQAALSDPATAQARPERAAAQFSFDIPLFFPGNPQPLRLEVTRDEEGETQEDGQNKPRSWTIRFAAEAGPLGMIHAAISQKGDQIGVQLWAERSETAALFKGSARDLQDSLEASNLKVEALKIAEGRPEEKAPRRAGEPAEAASPGEDYV